jgi:1-deoxy-D-xylulose-5-phosphate synthase
VTIENNSKVGGFGSAVLEKAVDLELEVIPKFIVLGLPDTFVSHGDVSHLLQEAGLDAENIAEKILKCASTCFQEKKIHNIQA